MMTSPRYMWACRTQQTGEFHTPHTYIHTPADHDSLPFHEIEGDATAEELNLLLIVYNCFTVYASPFRLTLHEYVQNYGMSYISGCELWKIILQKYVLLLYIFFSWLGDQH